MTGHVMYTKFRTESLLKTDYKWKDAVSSHQKKTMDKVEI